MGQNILGLDIGHATIKGVRLAKGLRGIRLVDSFVHPVPRGEAHDSSGPLRTEQIDLLNALLLEGKIVAGDLIALSIPGDLCATREMVLPFSDPKKLEQIVPYEAEAELPFDLDEVTIDYMTLQHRPEKLDMTEGPQHSRLLVSAIPNEVLAAYLDSLQPIGIDPAWIGPNPIALYAYAQYFLESGTGQHDDRQELLLIDIGASKTVLCDIQGGAIEWVRTIPIGGDQITACLEKELDLSWEEAEARKKVIGLNGHEANPSSPTEIAALQKGLEPLVTEIDKSIRTRPVHPSMASSEHVHSRVFHLCGGGGTLSGLQSHLSERLEMEAVSVDVGTGSKAASVIGVDTIDTNLASSVYAQAFGITFQESDGAPINFRKGPFVFGKETLEKRRHFVTIGLMLLLLLGLMGGNLYLRYAMKEDRYQALKQQLRNSFSETFPGTRNVVNEVDQTRNAIDTLKRTGAFLGVDELSPLAVLNAISEAIPKGVKIDVFNIVIDSGKVRIQAQTDSFESVDRIRGGLLGTTSFQKVEVSDAKVMADQSRVRFRIKMNVKKGRKGGEKRPS